MRCVGATGRSPLHTLSPRPEGEDVREDNPSASLESSFLLQLPDKPIVNQFFRFELADFFVGLSEQANDVAHAVGAKEKHW